MTKNRNDLRAGIFILLTAVAVAAIAIAIRGLAGLTTPTDLRSVRFELTDDVGGLRVGDDVRVGGFKVGQVHSITLETSAQGPGMPYVRVVYDFPRKYLLHQDAVLRIQGSAIGTASWLNFESLGNGPLLALSDQGFHGCRSSFSQIVSDLADLRDPIKQTVADLHAITQDVQTKTLPLVDSTLADARDTVGQVHNQLDPAFAKYHLLADHAVVMVDKIGEFFGSTTPDFRATLAHLTQIAAALHEKLPGILDRTNDLLVKLDQSVQSTNQALEDIKATAANAHEMTSSAKGIIVGNRGKFDAMIANVKTASESLKGASAEIRRSPWRLLYKPGSGEMSNLNLYDAARQFSDGAGELNDAACALRDALQDKNADPQQLQKLMQKLDTSFDHFNQVEKTLWDGVKE